MSLWHHCVVVMEGRVDVPVRSALDGAKKVEHVMYSSGAHGDSGRGGYYGNPQ